MDAQDQLERHYIGKKEEHRTLQMQNYMGVAINAGEFDPERYQLPLHDGSACLTLLFLGKNLPCFVGDIKK